MSAWSTGVPWSCSGGTFGGGFRHRQFFAYMTREISVRRLPGPIGRVAEDGAAQFRGNIGGITVQQLGDMMRLVTSLGSNTGC